MKLETYCAQYSNPKRKVALTKTRELKRLAENRTFKNCIHKNLYTYNCIRNLKIILYIKQLSLWGSQRNDFHLTQESVHVLGSMPSPSSQQHNKYLPRTLLFATVRNENANVTIVVRYNQHRSWTNRAEEWAIRHRKVRSFTIWNCCEEGCQNMGDVKRGAKNIEFSRNVGNQLLHGNFYFHWRFPTCSEPLNINNPLRATPWLNGKHLSPNFLT